MNITSKDLIYSERSTHVVAYSKSFPCLVSLALRISELFAENQRHASYSPDMLHLANTMRSLAKLYKSGLPFYFGFNGLEIKSFLKSPEIPAPF